MTTMILGVFVILALCVLIVIKRIDYRRESDYFYENNLDEYGENEEYTSEYIVDEVLMSTGYTILHMDSFDEKLLEREIIGIDAQ